MELCTNQKSIKKKNLFVGGQLCALGVRRWQVQICVSRVIPSLDP